MSKRFDEHIASLLEKHDCVIIPDFGGFVGNYASAKINPINNRVEPPYRKISFNKLLTHNDGLLASHIAQHQSISFDAAKNKLADYTVILSNIIKADKKVSFDRIGILYQNSDGTFRFEQIKDQSFFIEGTGLEAFYAKKVKQVKSAIKSVELKEELEPQITADATNIEPKVIPISKGEKISEPAEPYSKEKRRRLAVWPYAAVLLLPFVAYLAWLMLAADTWQNPQKFHTSNLNPFAEKNCSEYKLRKEAISPSVDLTEAFVVDWELAKENKEMVEVFSHEGKDKTLVVSLEEKVELARKKVESEFRFHIIGGCFADMRYARAMVSKYSVGNNVAEVIDKKGAINRVSIARFATKKEAKLALASYRDDIPNAWILYK